MKKNSIYILLFISICAIAGIVFLRGKQKHLQEENAVYTLLDRKGLAAQTEEWGKTRLRAAEYLQQIKATPGEAKPKLALSQIFIQEARITGNYSYYDKAAMKYVNDVLKTDSADFIALTYKALLYLSQHHFAEGLAIAEKARQVNPYNAFVYGLLVDGNVEMGHYDDAVANAQKMIEIRPDIRSYSRISYLREIYGDYAGAIEAMKMAVDAGAPGDESTEWARVQLGHLYENIGDLKSASNEYTIANITRPGFAYALAGLGRISVANGDYKKAITYYTQADSSVNDLSIKEALAETYQLSGLSNQALKLEEDVLTQMNAEAVNGQQDENIGHYVDKELAYAYLNQKEYSKALDHALLEYNRRPDNIDVNEAVAWVYYCKGDYGKAVPYIQAALKTQSKNPTLLCRAGLIFAKAGKASVAKLNLNEALKTNANITTSLKTESVATLKLLEASL